MEVLRLVMFGLLAVSLILGVTGLPVDQPEISSQDISSLNNMIKSARTDANLTFWKHCLRCVVNESAFNPPSFQGGNQTTGEMLQEIFHVCNNFTQLLDKFLSDITQQAGCSKLAEDLKILISISLNSIEFFLRKLKPDLQKGNTTVGIYTITDCKKRNVENLQIAGRMAIEMDKMSKVLTSFKVQRN